MDHLIFDNTKLADHKTCARKYYYRHIRQWAPEGAPAPALLFGLGWHSMMHTLWTQYKMMGRSDLLNACTKSFMETWIAEGGPAEMDFDVFEVWNPRVPPVAGEMLIHYMEQRKPYLEGSEVLESEQPFVIPLITDSAEYKVWYAGKKDKRIVLANGDTVVVEHKTTSEYRKNGGLKPDYVESWYMSSQVFGYLFSDNVLTRGNTSAVWVDIALVHKAVHDVFRFVPCNHKYDQLDQWLFDTRKRVQEIIDETDYLLGLRQRKEHRTIKVLPVFSRNEESCYGKYGAKCIYFNICTQFPNPEKFVGVPPGFVEAEWDPVERLKLEKVYKDLQDGETVQHEYGRT